MALLKNYAVNFVVKSYDLFDKHLIWNESYN